MKPIYLDANAGSLSRSSLDRAAELLADAGNPSSVHRAGQRAKFLLRESRRHICRMIGMTGVEKDALLSFTSGGTEACNQMIYGFLGPVHLLAKFPGRIVSTSIEHPCVLETLERLRKVGWEIVLVPPERSGAIDPEKFAATVTSETALVTMMTANNETGVLQPVESMVRILRKNNYNGPIVSDAVQSFGKVSLDARQLFDAGLDALSLSGHKAGAPAGIGAIVMSSRAGDSCRVFSPLLSGGNQEGGFRPGTENLLGIVAWGEAAKDLLTIREARCLELGQLRSQLWKRLSGIERVEWIGSSAASGILPNTLMVRFEGCRADDLVVALDVAGVMASTGSACSSGKQSASHVVRSMGYNDIEAKEAVRFSLDWNCSEDEINRAAEIIRDAVARARLSKSETTFEKSLAETRMAVP